jgi:hypothetical protein
MRLSLRIDPQAGRGSAFAGFRFPTDVIGYALVSTRDQRQLDALAAAGVEPRHTYVDKASGTLGAAAAVRRGPQASTRWPAR